jgi:adenosylcobinamide-GDP ribazoletransferase
MPDSLRLALGTFTRIPVPAPRHVNRRAARGAMLWAPGVGVLLALVLGGLAQLAAPRLGTSASPLLLAALVLAALAYLTRGLHLDGLADTADALGSGRPAADAMEIARRSDIGPFGVVSIVLVLLVQASAYAGLISDGRALLGLVVALGTGRLAVVVACTTGIPAARPEGLGATVAGTVPIWASAVESAAWLLAVAVVTWLDSSTGARPAVLAVIGSLAVAAIVVRVAVRRLGGITGDVLGATVELATTAALVILVAVPS